MNGGIHQLYINAMLCLLPQVYTLGLCPVPKKDEKGERGRGKKENRGNGKKLERNISVHHNLAQIIIGSILAMV